MSMNHYNKTKPYQTKIHLPDLRRPQINDNKNVLPEFLDYFLPLQLPFTPVQPQSKRS